MRYLIRGFTGPVSDFDDFITLPEGFDFSIAQQGDPRFNVAWGAMKEALLKSTCDGDYLDVFDMCDFEVRDDLANKPGQIVMIAEAMGCDNCLPEGDNEWSDGCDDSPHGGFMITLDPVGD